MYKNFLCVVACLVTFLVLVPLSGRAQTWKLVWSDEFDGPAGSAPDLKKWRYDIGGSGWGNNELQTYTDRRENSYLDGDGNLVIQALRETYTGPDGRRRDYTSARLNTAGRFTQQYGRIEARIQLPYGQGLWPAFWMLGNNIGSVGWPTCGEIDIMENIGREPSTNHGSLHGPGYSGGRPLTRTYTLPNGQRFLDDFHVFAIEWAPNRINFFVDDVLYQTRTPDDVPAGRPWVFDHPFFLILNVAVGGNFPGPPDVTTIFPQLMIVDYVRVYEQAAPASGPIAINAGGGGVGNFVSDTGFSGGNTASTGAAIDTSLVANPAPEAVYRTERWGACTYTMGGFTPGATYTVALHFAEIYWRTPGQRQFNVAINGQSVLTNFDIVAATGAPNKAIEKDFTPKADGKGTIVIQFTAGAADQPKISGIVITTSKNASDVHGYRLEKRQ